MKEFVLARARSLEYYWLLNLPLYIVILCSYLYFPTSHFSLKPLIYFCALSIGQAVCISWIALVGIPLLFNLMGLKKSSIIIALLLSTIIIYILLIDLFVYSQIHAHLDWPLVQMMLSPARVQIFNLTPFEYCVLFGVLLFLSLVEGLLWHLGTKITGLRQKILLLLRVILITLICVTQAIYMWADACYRPQLLTTTELIPWFHGATAKRFLAYIGLTNSTNRPDGISGSNNRGFIYPLHPITIKQVNSNAPNILIIAIDSWRFDSVSSAITPQIAKFMHISNTYINHFSGGNSTRAGLFSLFYSLDPRLFETFYRAGRGPVLFDILAKEGYRLAAFTSASSISPPFHRTLFINVPQFIADIGGKNSVQRDIRVRNKVLSFIKSQQHHNNPFMAFAFFDSAHAYNFPTKNFTPPFQPSAKVNHFNINNVNQQHLLGNQYKNALYFIDLQVGMILDSLKKLNLYENTIVVITADHAEEFNDNHQGYWGHNSNFTPAQTHVPLIIHWPGQKEAAVIAHVTSHYDILPTLINTVGNIENPLTDYSLGKLLNDSTPRDIILMGSYNDVAIFSPTYNKLAVTNRLGYFQMQDLQGNAIKRKNTDSIILSLGYQQMHHFALNSPGAKVSVQLG